MAPTIAYRQLTEADAPAYQELRLQALKEHPEAFGQSYESQRDTPLEAVQERLRSTERSRDDFIMGLFHDEVFRGMVGFRRDSGEKTRHKGHFWGMYVSAEAQGDGNGRELIRRAIEQAKSLPGLEQILLAVTSVNTPAYGLYRSVGFQTYGTEPKAMLFNGEYLDEYLMALLLNPGPEAASSE